MDGLPRPIPDYKRPMLQCRMRGARRPVRTAQTKKPGPVFRARLGYDAVAYGVTVSETLTEALGRAGSLLLMQT
jgi:hypothetical protein